MSNTLGMMICVWVGVGGDIDDVIPEEDLIEDVIGVEFLLGGVMPEDFNAEESCEIGCVGVGWRVDDVIPEEDLIDDVTGVMFEDFRAEESWEVGDEVLVGESLEEEDRVEEEDEERREEVDREIGGGGGA
jgi:hypothetical protein